MDKLFKFYIKMVIAITTFFAGVSGVLILTGVGAPGTRLLIGAVLFISLLNLTLYARDLYKTVRGWHPGGIKPEPAPANSGPKPPAGPQGGGGGGQGGNPPK